MAYETESSFPEGIDPLVFYQDMDIFGEEAVAAHEAAVAEGRYTEASEYASAQGIHGNYAGLHALLANRLRALQEYESGFTKRNPHHVCWQEPDVPDGDIWVETECGTYRILAKYTYSALSYYTCDELTRLF